jgi:hypothetical protein
LNKWYKIRRGTPFDPGLAVAGLQAGLSRAEIIALYLAVLDRLSAQEMLDPDVLSVMLDIAPARISGGIAALKTRKFLLPDNRAACWAQKPGSSTLRVRAWRAEQKRRETALKKRISDDNPDHPTATAARRERLTNRQEPAPQRSP